MAVLNVNGLLRLTKRFREDFEKLVHSNAVHDFVVNHLEDVYQAVQIKGNESAHKIRQNNKGGGLSLYVKKRLYFKLIAKVMTS